MSTLYWSGLPIDSIAPPTEPKDDPTFLNPCLQYQSIVGSLNWLAMTTRPDISPATSFLVAHANKPPQSHIDATLYALKYLCSTVNFGIAFHSHASMPESRYVHFPFHHDLEAYKDAI